MSRSSALLQSRSIHWEHVLDPDASAPDESEGLRELVVDELIASRVLHVRISGGEPLLVPGLAGLIERASKGGISVRITSNGVLLDERMARTLVDAGVDTVEISSHRGSEDKALRAASILHDMGVRVIARIVVNAEKCAGAEALAAPLVEAQVDQVIFQEVVPLGRAMDGATRFPPLDGLQRLKEDVRRMEEAWGKGRVQLMSVTLQDVAAGGPVACSISEGLRKSCEIRPDGNVLPCTPAAALGISNLIQEKGMLACWQDLPRLFGHIATEKLSGPCTSCSRAEACSGGCRALNMTATAEPGVLCRHHAPSS